VSPLRYMGTGPRANLDLPDPACHETTYCSAFPLFGFLVYAVPPRGLFFGFDVESPASLHPTGTQADMKTYFSQ
jgi:hypothetical protein